MKFERTFTVGNAIMLAGLVVTVILGAIRIGEMDKQIRLTKEAQEPYFIGSVTWSCSISLTEGGDALHFAAPARDHIAETKDWLEARQRKPKPTEFIHYVWVNMENVGSSVATVDYLEVSYRWQGTELPKKEVLNRYIRPGDRLFVLLFTLEESVLPGDLTSYLQQNLEFDEGDICVTFRPTRLEAKSVAQSIWPLPVLSPPALRKSELDEGQLTY